MSSASLLIASLACLTSSPEDTHKWAHTLHSDNTKECIQRMCSILILKGTPCCSTCTFLFPHVSGQETLNVSQPLRTINRFSMMLQPTFIDSRIANLLLSTFLSAAARNCIYSFCDFSTALQQLILHSRFSFLPTSQHNSYQKMGSKVYIRPGRILGFVSLLTHSHTCKYSFNVCFPFIIPISTWHRICVLRHRYLKRGIALLPLIFVFTRPTQIPMEI